MSRPTQESIDTTSNVVNPRNAEFSDVKPDPDAGSGEGAPGEAPDLDINGIPISARYLDDDVRGPDANAMIDDLTDRLTRSPWVELRALHPARDEKGKPRFWAKSFWCNSENVEDAVGWAVYLQEHKGYSAYATINPIPATPYDVGPGVFKDGPTPAAEDKHVTGRRELYIDLDPKRATNTAATDEQRGIAEIVAGNVRKFLAEQGWGEPYKANDSGNGFSLHYLADWEDAGRDLVNELLARLHEKFGGALVTVDTTVSNASRINRIAGSVNTKGDPGSWRRVKTLERNPDAKPVPRELVEKTVELLPKPAGKRPPGRPSKPKAEPSAKNAQGSTKDAPKDAPPGAATSTPGEWEALLAAAENKGEVTIDGTAYPFEDRYTRCKKFLAGVPDDGLSRWGKGETETSPVHGSGTFYRHLRCFAVGFLIRDRDALAALAALYNDRLREADEKYPDRPGQYVEWEGRELEHKLDQALDVRIDPDYPPGHLLPRGGGDVGVGGVGDGLPRSWNDPDRIAGEFAAETTVRFLKKTAFQYHGGCYRPLDDDTVRGVVREFIVGRAASEFKRSVREWGSATKDERDDLRAREANLTDKIRQGGAMIEHDEKDLERVRARLEKVEKSRPAGVQHVTNKLVGEVLGALKSRQKLDPQTKFDTWLDGSDRPAVLPIKNGLLDPVGRVVLPPSEEWFGLAGQLPVEFAPDATCPVWESVVNELMMGDAELVALIQEMFGCTLTDDPVKNFFVPFGGGDNGKSVVLNVLGYLLGEANVAGVTLDDIGGNRFAGNRLLGKLANLVGDQGYIESRDEGALKKLTGEDLVPFEAKGKDAIDGRSRARLFFACNTMPTFSDKSEAIWNRLVIIPFNYTVPKDRQNGAMLTRTFWESELPGILNWALAGLARLRANKGRFTMPAAVRAANEEHRKDSNPAHRFLLDGYEVGGPYDAEPSGALYAAYRAWLVVGGYTSPLTRERFAREVKAAFPHLPKNAEQKKIKGINVRVWPGIKPRTDA